jgi:S-adenosylmethionine:tRNA ribosyltransferase-isomerase
VDVSLFDYHLPQALIAQQPLEPRDSSRLLYLPRTAGPPAHSQFARLADYLRPGDLLVFNHTRVLPARLPAQKAATGGRAECLLLRQEGPDIWECLVKPGRRLPPGTRLIFGGGQMEGEIGQRTAAGGRLVRFFWRGEFQRALAEVGEMPLPPYIRAKLADGERYQTVYGDQPGSAAAPTAGLHFTQAALAALAEKGVETARVLLHVGLGTFRPVAAERVEDHVMHREYYELTEAAAAAINGARAAGRRVIAVGTTTVRVLETLGRSGALSAGQGWTEIFIYPGYQFKVVDGLLTNFHLPRSTLLMLVSALAGRERVLAAYQEAIAASYRFFSFGDAMLIL